MGCCRRCCSYCCYAFLVLLSLLVSLLVFLELRFRYIQTLYPNLPSHNETFFEKSHPSTPTVLFATETISLSEMTRMMFVARHLRNLYPPEKLALHFFHYSGAGSFRYEDMLYEDAEKLGYEVHVLSPRWETEEDIQRLYDVDRMEVIGDFLPEEAHRTRIREELDLYCRIKPVFILTGFVLSARLSSKIAGIPYGIVLPIMVPPYDLIVQDLFRGFPNFFVDFVKSIVPRKSLNRLLFWVGRRVWYMSGQFRQISLEYGIRPVHDSLFSMLEGDYTFTTDVPVLTGVSESELKQLGGDSYQYVGPMFANLEIELPEDVRERIEMTKQNGKKVLYFAMGSSGQQKHVENILFSLDQQFKSGEHPLLSEIGLVISPTKRLLYKFPEDEKRHREFVENLDPRIMLTDILPAPEVNAMSDLAILHGGQGTIQTAVIAGLPFVGIPAQFEQDMNIKMVVTASARHDDQGLPRSGAIFVPKPIVMETGEPVVEALVEMLADYSEFKKAMSTLQSAFKEYDVREIIEEIVRDLLGWKTEEN